MVGERPGRVIGIRTFGDELLAAIAPVGLALAAETALVLDADDGGPSYPGERTVAELAEDGPTRAELRPERGGVALIANGGADPLSVAAVVEMLAPAWPAIVVRVGHAEVPFPVIPVRPLWPGFLAPVGSRPAVWQRVPGGSEPPGSGPVLPPPERATINAILAGRKPFLSRWVRAWRKVWGLPWE
jgi:hypothetical protein